MKLRTILAGSLTLLVVGVSTALAQPASAPPTVTIDNFAFAPAEMSVAAGTTLTWANKQNARHTTTANNGEWDSGILATNETFELTFDALGDFTYHCDIHPEMVGIVHVTAAAADTPAAAIDEFALVEDQPVDGDPVGEDAPASQVAPTLVPTPAPAQTTAPSPPAAAPTPAPKPQQPYYGY